MVINSGGLCYCLNVGQGPTFSRTVVDMSTEHFINREEEGGV